MPDIFCLRHTQTKASQIRGTYPLCDLGQVIRQSGLPLFEWPMSRASGYGFLV
jgi:hypothetical protein